MVKLFLLSSKIKDLFFEFILNQYFRRFQNESNLSFCFDNQDIT